jgi:hypothetical protein
MSRCVRLEVFGRRMNAEFDGERWRLFDIAEGRRTPVPVVIPAFVPPEEVCEYLFDLWHESATGSRSDVRRLPEA